MGFANWNMRLGSMHIRQGDSSAEEVLLSLKCVCPMVFYNLYNDLILDVGD